MSAARIVCSSKILISFSDVLNFLSVPVGSSLSKTRLLPRLAWRLVLGEAFSALSCRLLQSGISTIITAQHSQEVWLIKMLPQLWNTGKTQISLFSTKHIIKNTYIFIIKKLGSIFSPIWPNYCLFLTWISISMNSIHYVFVCSFFQNHHWASEHHLIVRFSLCETAAGVTTEANSIKGSMIQWKNKDTSTKVSHHRQNWSRRERTNKHVMVFSQQRLWNWWGFQGHCQKKREKTSRTRSRTLQQPWTQVSSSCQRLPNLGRVLLSQRLGQKWAKRTQLCNTNAHILELLDKEL